MDNDDTENDDKMPPHVVPGGHCPRLGYSQLAKEDLSPTSLTFYLLSIIPHSDKLSKGCFPVHPPLEAGGSGFLRGLEAEAGRQLIGRGRGALCEEKVRPRDDT